MNEATSTPQKIVYVNHTGLVSGAEKVLLVILEHLDRSRFEATVTCPPGTDLSQIIENKGVKFASLPHVRARFTWNPSRLWRYFRSYFNSIRDIRRSRVLESADLVHANSVRAGLLASFAARGTGIPVIWHVHDTMKKHPISMVIRCVALFLSPLSIIAVSRSTEKRFKGRLLRFASKRIPSAVIYNAVDMQRFHPEPSDRERVRTSLHLGSDHFVFATIGQLTPRKGQLETIRAFHRLSSRVPNVRLLVVGAAIFDHDHQYFESLKREVETLGLQESVLFLGQRSDVNAVLAASDSIIVNSKQEPFGLIALEALAAGKPVVAASVDGIPELMKDGETGLLTPLGDEEALVHAMQRVLSDPELYGKLASQGRMHVATYFTCASYIQQLEQFYSETALRSKRQSEAIRG